MIAGAGAAYLNGGFGIWEVAFTIATSSLGCAVCDPVIALWCFAGAPAIYDLFRRGEGKQQLRKMK
jgi:hypothetical protein